MTHRRIALTAVCLLAAPVLAGCGGESSPTVEAPPTVPASSTVSSTAGPTGYATSSPVAPSGAQVLDVQVADGKAQGGVQRFTVAKGAHVTLRVSSDAEHEIHLHGYDLTAEVVPGGQGMIEFKASLAGVFEIELEDTTTKIAQLTVR